MTFLANVSDETSGINRVYFVVDCTFIGSFTEPPYEVSWIGFLFVVCLKFMRTGDWEYLPHCIPYDNAGNTIMSPTKK